MRIIRQRVNIHLGGREERYPGKWKSLSSFLLPRVKCFSRDVSFQARWSLLDRDCATREGRIADGHADILFPFVSYLSRPRERLVNPTRIHVSRYSIPLPFRRSVQFHVILNQCSPPTPRGNEWGEGERKERRRKGNTIQLSRRNASAKREHRCLFRVFEYLKWPFNGETKEQGRWRKEREKELTPAEIIPRSSPRATRYLSRPSPFTRSCQKMARKWNIAGPEDTIVGEKKRRREEKT